MFTKIIAFELKTRLKRISTWVYFGIFFLLAFLGMLSISGMFKNVEVGLAGSGGIILMNSPYVLFNLISVLSYLGILISAAVMADAGCRDFGYQSHPLFFTCPIKKISYLGGRYVGALIVLIIILSGLGIGALIGTWFPGLDSSKLGPNHLMYYLQPYIVSVLPNLVFNGALFFSLAVLTRKSIPTYVCGVILLIGYMIASTLLADIENEFLAGLIDPFGLSASGFLTRYWTAAEKNTLLIPLNGLLLLNRALWTGVGLIFLLYTSLKFKFTYYRSERLSSAREKVVETKKDSMPQPVSAIPHFSRIFSLGSSLQLTARLMWLEFRGIIVSLSFLVIVFAGVLFMIANSTQLDTLYGTITYPVTYKILDITSGSFDLFMIIIIAVYAGELVWKERRLNFDQMVDVLPTPRWVPYLSKLGALILVQVLLLGIVLLCGIGIQVFQGYFHFEIGLYLKELFGIQLIDYILFCVLAMLIQTLAPHKYIGHFLMILFFLATLFMHKFGLEHNLYHYASDPGVIYSDMNGYTHMIGPLVIFKIYWGAFAIVLAVLTYLFWRRGTDTGFWLRLALARHRLGFPVTMTTIVAIAVFATIGAFIFYNTNILNSYKTQFEQQADQASYEKKYKQYEFLPQPRIIDVNVNVDIYPNKRELYVQGTYILKNKTDQPINSVHIRLHPSITLDWLAIGSMQEKALQDHELGYSVYRLPAPMLPGDELPLTFELSYCPKGFKHSIMDEEIILVSNGTFINNGYFPRIGYDAQWELAEDDIRKKHGLAPKARMADVDDLQARMNTYISNDADWINYEAVVSTAADQIAITPGTLKKEWTEGNRRYFHYSMEGVKTQHFSAFLSGKYEVKRDTWHDVEIEVYYHPGHEYNVERMIRGVKSSLDYYTTHFSPYPYQQVRIVEFPRYATFAQAFSGMIPYSESIGFIARVNETDESDIDYPFYVTAHEMGHQWWAHQLIGGNVQGSTLMSESLAQYSALMVMEHEFGRDQMKRFLQYELDRYLSGRSFEKKHELPLYRVEDQGYIYYNKGSVVMYALRDYIGADRVNAALARYLQDKGYQEPPYTNSIEFLNYLQETTPERYQYLIEDLFETITLFHNKAVSARAAKLDNGKYQVLLTVEAQKLRAGETGAETKIPLNDWIDIGILGEDGRELYLKKAHILKSTTEFTIVVDDKPIKAGIDVYNKLIDRNSDDNLVKVKLDTRGIS